MSAPDQTENTQPDKQIGPFRIEGELGRGAVGVVYLARDTKLDRRVALKSLPADTMTNPQARSRFSREARLLASLNHPNIAAIYEELEEADGVSYLVLEYVPGRTLAELISEGGLRQKEALAIALQIADALAAAHDRGVIHRDLKPDNIKITPEDEIKILDFGLAKAVGDEARQRQTTVTEPGRVLGTPAYMLVVRLCGVRDAGGPYSLRRRYGLGHAGRRPGARSRFRIAASYRAGEYSHLDPAVPDQRPPAKAPAPR
ncbi:MAG: serine/threonine-protein kinase [Planctomycetota bacterium]|jgi:serine/threonine protein kinase